MKWRDLAEGLKAMQSMDLSQLERAAKRMEQDAAYGSYAYNIYISGYLDGWRKNASVNFK